MKFKPNLIIYFLAGVFFFIFWMIVVFPEDAVESRVITEIENQTQGRYLIDTKDMDVSLLGSVTFKDLKLSEMVGGKKELMLQSPKLKVGFSPLGVLSQKVDFTFDLKGSKKGDLEGAIKKKDTQTDFALELDEYPLEELKFLGRVAKVNIKGLVDGDIDLQINTANPQSNDGEIDINLENIQTDATKISLDPNDPAASFPIPPIKVTGPKGSHIKAEVKQNFLNINSVKLAGGDITLDLKGKISLNGRSFRDYRMDLNGNFRISDTLNKTLPIGFILDKQKAADGSYPLRISGRMGKPQIMIGKFRVPL